MVHGVLVVGPIVSSSLAVARFLAAERALVILKDPESEKCLSRICICGQEMAIDMLDVDSLAFGDEMLVLDFPGSSDLENTDGVISTSPEQPGLNFVD